MKLFSKGLFPCFLIMLLNTFSLSASPYTRVVPAGERATTTELRQPVRTPTRYVATGRRAQPVYVVSNPRVVETRVRTESVYYYPTPCYVPYEKETVVFVEVERQPPRPSPFTPFFQFFFSVCK